MEQAAQQINQIDLEHLTDEETVNVPILHRTLVYSKKHKNLKECVFVW